MKSRFGKLVAFLAAFLCSLSISAQSGGDLTFYASLNYQPGWASLENPPYGIYSFNNSQNLQLTPEFLDSRLQVNGGAVYIDGKYYMIGYDTYDDGMIHNVFFRVFDMDNGAKMVTNILLEGRMSEIPTDLTYDPSTDRVYGCFYQNDGTFVLGILNLNTGVYETVGELPEQLVALASNREGDLYGVGIFGGFYKVNKENAHITLVGRTGLTVRYAQSATFDYQSGKLYWASSMHDITADNGFYEINLTTGIPKLIANFPDQSTMTGLYIKSPYTLSDAPAAPELSLEYTDAEMNGNVVFTMPTTTFDGKMLDSDLEYTLYVDDSEVKTGKAASGQRICVPYVFLSEGYHWAQLRVKNAVGRAPHCTARKWIGMDQAKVNNVTAAVEKSGVKIAWTAPVEGVNGGYIASEKMSYNVVRMPDSHQVYSGTVTECVDTDVVEVFDKYWYEVTVFMNGKSGPIEASNLVTLGKALSIPYVEKFSYANGFDLFTVVDDNRDNVSWFYDREMGCATYEYSEEMDADDWLVTPPLEMDAEQLYSLTFLVAAGDDCFKERMKVAMGTGYQPKELNQVLMEPFVIDWAEDYEKMTVNFVPQESGANFIGFQACSDANNYMINLDEVMVKHVASVYAPSAVTGLKVTPGALGALTAVVECVLPQTDIRGERLSVLEKVELYCDGKLVAEEANVAGGKRYTFPQLSFERRGMHKFAVVASNSRGAGIKEEISCYVGDDDPDYVPNLKARVDEKGNVTLTWDVPTVGRNGGYVNPDGIKYTVMECDKTKRGTVTGTSYTATVDMTISPQELLWYDVKAVSSRGSGLRTYSDTLFVGVPYELPFEESFYHGSYQQNPWNAVGDGVAEWEVRSYTGYEGGDPKDTDGGMIAFVPYLNERQASLTSPKLSLKNTTHPTLRFWGWHNARAHNMMYVRLHTDKDDMYTLAVIDQSEVNGPEEYEWRFYEFQLDEYVKGCNYVQVEFFGKNLHTDMGMVNLMLIDDIRVFSYYEQDLAFTRVENPIEVSVGSPIDFKVMVTNEGSKVAENYQVELYRDNRLVNSVACEWLEARDSLEVMIQDIPNADAAETSYYQVKVRMEGDELLENNASEQLPVTVLPGMPYVDTLKGHAANGNAVISWESPYENKPVENDGYITDDFESYPAFSITNVGRWKMHDGDQGMTFGIQDGHGNFVDYPNQGKKMAFMVFNPSEAGLDNSWGAYSGKQVMACFFGYNKANDDWLISPKVDGDQTISFQAQSTHNEHYGSAESFEVLYSKTDDDVNSFIRIDRVDRVPGRWHKYSYRLPADAKYFAIRCVSNEQYILYIDDVTYRPANSSLTLKGYNVYRDGEQVNGALVTDTRYQEPFPGDEKYAYQVSVVYDKGESVLSNKILIDKTSSVEDAEYSAVKVVSLSGRIEITGAEQHPVVICTSDGVVVHHGMGDASVAVQRGVYLVKVGNEVLKVMVRESNN